MQNFQCLVLGFVLFLERVLDFVLTVTRKQCDPFGACFCLVED